jgi:hypothetical protein
MMLIAPVAVILVAENLGHLKAVAGMTWGGKVRQPEPRRLGEGGEVQRFAEAKAVSQQGVQNLGHLKAVAGMTGRNMDPYMGRAFVGDGLATMLTGAINIIAWPLMDGGVKCGSPNHAAWARGEKSSGPESRRRDDRAQYGPVHGARLRRRRSGDHALRLGGPSSMAISAAATNTSVE